MTIKELSLKCGVSEQAIRKWCQRNQVAKHAKLGYCIDEATEQAILRHYGVEVAKPSCETYETTKELIEMLKKELEAKDKQIESLQNALDNTTEALKNSQESLKVAQLLQGNAEQKLKLLEAKEEPEEQKRSLWSRLFN